MIHNETCPHAQALRLCCPTCDPLGLAIKNFLAAERQKLRRAIHAAREGRDERKHFRAVGLPPSSGPLSQSLPPCAAEELKSTLSTLRSRANLVRRVISRQIALNRWMAIAPRLYQATVVDHLPHPDLSKRVIAYSSPDYAQPGDAPGVLLVGPTGAGKTRTVFLMIRRWMTEEFFGDVTVFAASDIADNAIAKSRSGTIGEWVESVCNSADAIVIDDLGHGTFSASYAECLRRLFEKATSNGIPLIVTCQFDGAGLLRRWSRDDPDRAETAKAIVRRLGEFCRFVSFPAKSPRQ